MISVIIPTLDAEAGLAATLSALVPAAVDGLVREVVIADGGSRDRTLEIAEDAGVVILKTGAGRGHQLRAGAAKARFPWLLFLHADTVLDSGWEREAGQHIDAISSGRTPQSAAVFRFALDDTRFAARVLEAGVAFRAGLLKLPYGDQGLLLSRRLYDDIGGHSDLPLMEDVAIVRRLGRNRIRTMRAKAITSARRYRERGYVRRIVRNQLCLALYFSGAPMSTIQRMYARTSRPGPDRAVAALKSGIKP